MRVPYAAELRGLKSDCQNILTTVTFDLVAEDKQILYRTSQALFPSLYGLELSPLTRNLQDSWRHYVHNLQ